MKRVVSVDWFLAKQPGSGIAVIEAPGTLDRHALTLGIFVLFGFLIVAIISRLRSAVRRADELDTSARANEGKLYGLMESAPDAMVIETSDRRFAQVNSKVETLFGYRRDELVGQSVEMLVPEKDRATFAARHKAFLEYPDMPPARGMTELILVRKDGSEISVEISMHPIHTDDGVLTCIAIRDLTRRKLAEETLRASEERHRTLSALLSDAFDASDDGIALYDSEDRLVLTNKTLKDSIGADLFVPGRTYEEIIRAYWAGSEFAEDRDAFERYVAADVEMHRRGDGTRRTQHRVGRDFWVVNRDFRTRDGGVLHTATNVSALVRAKEAAEQASLSKSRFLAAASHDLRQPLQTMALLQGVLKRTVTDTRSQTVIDTLGASVGSMSDILNSLLELQQLEAGVVTPNIGNFVIGDLLERICAELRLHAETKGLHLRNVRSRAAVRSDPSLLEQIIRNLLSNAIKYTDRGKILVGCRRRGEILRIEVRDTGIGIAEDQVKAIFEEFRQIDNPARDRRKGLGLGLSIAQRLALLLGHTIDVRAIQGKGAVFSIELPLAEHPLSTAERAESLQNSEAMDILLVEDDPSLRWSQQAMLELLGHKVVATEDAKGALARLGETDWRPDVVVSDFNLPGGMDGLELVRQIRTRFHASIPAVLLTGDVSLTLDAVLPIRSCVVLRKPADPAAIVAAARSFDVA
jgi:PAS domain S-box-containing protein